LIGNDGGASQFTANALELAQDAADGFPTGFAQTGSNATTLVLQAEHNSTDVDMTGYGVLLTYDSDPNIVALGVVTAHNQGTATLTIERNGGGALERALDTDVEYVIAPAAFTYLLQIKALVTTLAASAGAPVTLETGQLDDVLARLPEALSSGRMPAAVEAMSNNVITDAIIGTDLDVYTGIIQLAEDADETDTTDVWTIEWYKNNQRITSGVTATTLTVRALVAATTLINAQTMTEFSTSEVFIYQATGVSKADEGVAYLAEVTSTIDGASRVASAIVRG
jgi:hypothetical protein